MNQKVVILVILVSPDGTYNKTYYIPIIFRVSWMGSYQLCKANDMTMLTFDCQDEHDKFIAVINKQVNTISGTLYLKTGVLVELYFGSYAKIGGDPNGWIWYDSGVKVTGPVKMRWNGGEPNNSGNREWCATMALNGGVIGMNDMSCIEGSFSKNVVCQETTRMEKGMDGKFNR